MAKRVLLFSNDTAKQAFEFYPTLSMGARFDVCLSDLNLYVSRLNIRSKRWWAISEVYYVDKGPESDNEPNIRAILYSEYGRCRYLLYRRNCGRYSRETFHWSLQKEFRPYTKK